MPSTPFIQVFPGDWFSLVDVARMTARQFGAFWLLLFYQWLERGPEPCSLPNDDIALAQLARFTAKEWSTEGRLVKEQFPPIDGHPDRCRNHMLHAIYLDVQSKHDRRVRAGAMGGVAKAIGKQSASNATDILEHSSTNGVERLQQSEPEPEPEPQSEKTTTSAHAPRNGKADLASQFEELWANRPIRAGTDSKTAALKAYHARIREGVLHSTLAQGVARYKAFCTATGKVGTEFTMALAAFLGPKQHYLTPYDLPTEGGLTAEQRIEVERLVDVCLRFGVFHLTSKGEIDQVCALIAEEMTFSEAEIRAKLAKLNFAKCLQASDRGALTRDVAGYLFGTTFNRTNGNGSHRANGHRRPREYDYSKTTDRLEDIKWQT